MFKLAHDLQANFVIADMQMLTVAHTLISCAQIQQPKEVQAGTSV